MQAVASSGSDPYVGLSFDDQFRIDEPIGAGAMARVYRARQLGVERDVAIKILKRELAGRPDVLARFRREAELAARLAHPHVVVVHAIGSVPLFGPELGGEPYTALEYLEGPSLAALLEREGVLPLGRALHIVLGLCDAIGEAHARGIVHRDLKPDNVLLVQRGDDADFVKVLDFGLAKAQKSAVDLQTRAGAVLGTPRYVSPEGAQGDEVGPAGDCYALATLLYQCLVGRTPFDTADPLTLLAEQVNTAPPDIRSLATAAVVPEPLARVIMQNLSKLPSERAPDARVLGRALVEASRRAHLGADEIGLSSTLLGTKTTRHPSTVRAVAAVPAGPSLAFEATPKLALAGPSRPPSPSLTPSRRGDDQRPSDPKIRARRRRVRAVRRAATFIACFVLGIVAALGIASGFGVFERPLAGQTP
jgi:eukaryotic-like serine/threonine-protein kinase